MPKRLITVSGPRGAGKETILNFLLQQASCSSRVVPFTTRPPRISEENGREYNFISKDEYLFLKENNLLVYSTKVGDYFTGTQLEEFNRHTNAVIDITVEGALTHAQYPATVKLFVFAHPHERCKRIMLRQNVSFCEARRLMSHEPSPAVIENVWALYQDFEIILNHDHTPEAGLLASARYTRDFLCASAQIAY